MIYLSLQAPYAAFRTFAAGWYRPTARFVTPSAAYGLLLNLAGIETRRDDGLSDMTLTRFGLPPMRLAVGADPGRPLPTVQSVFQQLHNYPVGESGGARQQETWGNKYNITPVRRELLVDLHAHLAVDTDSETERRIVHGIEDPGRVGPRYGIPFLGDNAFLLDKATLLRESPCSRWYRRLGSDPGTGLVPDATRLTIWIDRGDMSKTSSALYAPMLDATGEIPDDAWTAIDPPSEPISTKANVTAENRRRNPKST